MISADSDVILNEVYHTFDEFFGCYLLCSENPKFKGRTYIGFTVDPNRRIKQHNKGQKAGGAKSTANKGPWEMILIVHGFPNDIAALRFEWAWQNPQKSRRLSNPPKRTLKETPLDYRMRIMLQMLNTGPWNRLPLVIRWLSQREIPDYLHSTAPTHIAIVYGPMKRKKRIANENEAGILCNETKVFCYICNKTIPNETALNCLNDNCGVNFHDLCLAQNLLGSGTYLIPVEGPCPNCSVLLLWGDIILERKISSTKMLTSKK